MGTFGVDIAPEILEINELKDQISKLQTQVKQLSDMMVDQASINMNFINLLKDLK